MTDKERIAELEARVNRLAPAMNLLRQAATLIHDLTNGCAVRELHRTPDSWRAEAEQFFNTNGDTLDD